MGETVARGTERRHADTIGFRLESIPYLDAFVFLERDLGEHDRTDVE